MAQGPDRLKFESSFIPSSSMHALSVGSDLFDCSLHFFSFLIISLSPCCSCCLTTSTSLLSWINHLCNSAEDLGTLAENNSSTKGTSRVPIRCWNLSFDIAFSTKEIMREAGGPTTASKKKLKRIARYLKGRQRCVLNFPWVEKLDDVIHVTEDADWTANPKTRCSTPGGALASGSCFTVRHWSVTQATVSVSSAESQAKAITNRRIQALYVKHLLQHQTALTFKIEVLTDSSAKAIIQRLGPGRRAKHLEVQTMWVQSLNKLGLISMNKLGKLENVADMMTKHVPRGVLDNLAGMMGYSFTGEEIAKFQECSSIEQSLLETETHNV